MIKKHELRKFKSLFLNIKKSFLNQHDEETWKLFKNELISINYSRSQLLSLVALIVSVFYIVIHALSYGNGNEEPDLYLAIDICLLSLISVLFFFQILGHKFYPSLVFAYRKKISFATIIIVVSWAALVSGVELAYNNYVLTFLLVIILFSAIFYYRSYTAIGIIIYGIVLLFCSILIFFDASLISLNNILPLIIIATVACFISKISLSTRVKAFVNHYEMMVTKKQLDDIVETRTQELQVANATLQNEIKVRKNLEDILRKAKIRAEESDRLKSAFLANVSHEIRTPMNGILGFVELLTSRNLPESKKKIYMDIVRNNSKHLLTVLDDIIDISKIESNQIEINYQKVPLGYFLKEIYIFFQNYRNTNNKTQIAFDIDIPSPEPIEHIICDPIRLRQIFTNLLKNAFKFTNKGSIKFGYSLNTSGELLFFVKDTGIGIKEEDQVHVFERFRQLDYSERRLYEGSGLGLSICKSLVDLMKGKIWLESNPKKGTTIYFSLPLSLKNEEHHHDLYDTQVDDIIDWSSKTILIVEDDDISYNLLVEILSPYKLEIIHAISGDKAVETCKKNDSIDLVLMDLRLPILDGYKAASMIKKFRMDLPIIAQTANALIHDRQKSLDAGCDDYLSKPINSFELITKIKKYLL